MKSLDEMRAMAEDVADPRRITLPDAHRVALALLSALKVVEAARDQAHRSGTTGFIEAAIETNKAVRAFQQDMERE